MNFMKLPNRRRVTVIMVCLLIVAATLPTLAAAQTGPVKDGRYYEAAARKAYQAKDYPAFLANMKLAAQLRPNHPRLLYNLAAAYAINGRSDEALSALRQVAEMGMIVPPLAILISTRSNKHLSSRRSSGASTPTNYRSSRAAKRSLFTRKA